MAKAAYHVVGSNFPIEPRLTDNGLGIEDHHVVPFVIDSGPAAGQRRHVKVPHSQWSAGAAKAMIEEDVDIAHDVASLKQG